MKNRPIVLVLLLLFCIGNMNYTNANTLAAPPSGDAISLAIGASAYNSSISTVGDEDWYYFDAVAGSYTYEIETHGSSDMIIYLYQSNRTTLIQSNDDGGYALNSKIIQVLSSGRYYIKAAGYGTSTGSYSIDVICSDCGEDSDFNPPRNLRVAEEGSNYIDLAWDAPLVTTGLSEYRVYMSGSANGSYNFIGTSSTNTVRASNLSTTTAYWFYVTASYINPTGESNPSNTVSGQTGGSTGDASLIVVGAAAVNTTIGVVGEEDWYYFDAESGSHTYVIETHGTTDMIIYLYQSNRTTLIYSDDDSGNSLNSKMTQTLASGRYYIKAVGYGTSTGSYSIDVICSDCAGSDYNPPRNLQVAVEGDDYIDLTWDAPVSTPSTQGTSGLSEYSIYRSTSANGNFSYIGSTTATTYRASSLASTTSYWFYVTAKYTNPTGESNPSNTVLGQTGGSTGDAIHLALGASAQNASISTVGEEDWFYFDGESDNHTYVIETFGTSDMIIYLYQSNQTTLIISDDDSGSALNSKITKVLSSGRYYIKATGYGSSTGSYSIGVRCNDCAGSDFNPPRNLRLAVEGDDYIDLAWDAPLNSGSGTFNEYRVYMSTSSNGNFNYIGSSSTTTLRASYLAATTSFWFYVTATYTSPTGESNPSNTVTGQTGGSTGDALQLVVGASAHSSSISVVGDQDWYYFDAESGSNTYIIESHGTTDMIVYLYQDDRTTLVTSDDDSGSNLNSKITQALSAGRYYIKAVGYGSSTGTYSIDVVCNTCSGSSFNPPRNLIVSVEGDDYIDLSWDAPLGSGSGTLSEYRIYRSNSSNGNFSFIGTSSTTAYRASGLASTTSYWIYVTARYTSPTGESNPSNTVYGQTGGSTGDAVQLAVGASATSSSISTAGEEDWYYFDASSGSHTYVIESHGSTDMLVFLYQTDRATLIDSDDDSGYALNSKIIQVLVSGRYFVKAAGYGSSTGSYSIDVSCTDCGGDSDYNPPRSLQVIVEGDDYIDLGWVAPLSGTGDLSEYRIYRSTSAGGSYILIGTSTSTSTTFRASNLATSTSYWFYVTASYTNPTGESNPSSTVVGLTGGSTGDARLLTVGATAHNATISTVGEEDWYYFDAESGSHTYVIETHGDSDMIVYLYQSNRTTLIDSNDDGGFSLNSKISQVLTSGRYYIKAVGYGSTTGAYSIDVVCSECGGSSDFNSPRNARVTAEGDNYIDLAWDAPIGSGSGTLSGYRIYRSTSANGYYDFVGTSSTTTVRAGNLATTTSYWFYITATYTSPTGESNPSNTVIGQTGGSTGDALPLFVGASATSASISSRGEEDWYYFDTESGSHTYVIETHGSSDMLIYLYQADRTTLIAVDDDGGFALNSKITELLTSGRYYVKVVGYGLSTGAYTIDVICSDCGMFASGIDDIAIHDFTLMAYPNPSNGKFTMSVSNAESADLIIELLSLSGQVVYRSQVKAVVSYTEEIHTNTLAKGVYYLRVNNGWRVEVEKLIIQ